MASGLIAESYFMRKLGLIAGNGKFPLIFAEQAKLEGVSLVAVAHRGETPKAIEKVVEERIFGKVISRWTDRIQMLNAERASLDRGKLDRAKQMHEEFSRYIEAHNQSDEMVQHTPMSLAKLNTDIQEVKSIAERQPASQ